MKKLIITSILALLVAAGSTLRAQDYPEEYLGLPGDNLNLYAVMDLFQEAETLEGFERNLNDENSRINNLDLNGDNLIDYITVNDFVDGNVHTIVLRTALNRNENQDVAVFTVQQLRNGEVQIQLIGDQDLYGRNYIVEPIYAETPNPGYNGNANYRANNTVVTTTYYEVAAWPLIRFIYRPTYVVWRSNWYWGYYPSYWNPWRPYYWHYYYGYHSHWYPYYYEHYRHWSHPRYTRYNDFYYGGIRSHSHYVSNNIRDGKYKSTYSRPEQRREGEAMYTRTQASRSNTSRGNASVSTEGRRASSPASTSTRTQSSAGQGNGTERRSAGTTATGRSNSTSAPAQRTQAQSSTTQRRSPASVSDRPVSKSAPAQRAQSSGSSRQSPPAQRAQSQAPSRKSAPAARTSSSRSSSSGSRRSSSGSSKSNTKS
ncbi:MAG TPA: hypothetical protein VMV74_00580, partial [Bacteroidales bacterium]|nr:hypothetical protein [Bacteroidales bacterium]